MNWSPTPLIVAAFACLSCSDRAQDETLDAQKILEIDTFRFSINIEPDVLYCPVHSGPGLIGYSMVRSGEECPTEVPMSQQDGVVSVYGEFNATYHESAEDALHKICAQKRKQTENDAAYSLLRFNESGLKFVGCQMKDEKRNSYFFLLPQGSWQDGEESSKSVPRILIHVDFSLPIGKEANARQTIKNVSEQLILEEAALSN